MPDNGWDRLAEALAPGRAAGSARPDILDAAIDVLVERGHERTRYRDVAERARRLDRRAPVSLPLA